MKNWDRNMAMEAHYEAFDDLLTHLQEAHQGGATIKQLATDCDVTEPTIRAWLNYDIMFPHFKTICKVAAGLGLKIQFVTTVEWRKAA